MNFFQNLRSSFLSHGGPLKIKGNEYWDEEEKTWRRICHIYKKESGSESCHCGGQITTRKVGGNIISPSSYRRDAADPTDPSHLPGSSQLPEDFYGEEIACSSCESPFSKKKKEWEEEQERKSQFPDYWKLAVCPLCGNRMDRGRRLETFICRCLRNTGKWKEYKNWQIIKESVETQDGFFYWVVDYQCNPEEDDPDGLIVIRFEEAKK